jgi:hypothetical protein
MLFGVFWIGKTTLYGGVCSQKWIEACTTSRLQCEEDLHAIGFSFSFLFCTIILAWEAQRKDRDLVLIMAFRSAGLRGKLSAVSANFLLLLFCVDAMSFL